MLIHTKYRPDIDGLRAIAVLSVVGFHAFPDYIKGGFVGVDVFFVISGFLISSIIFSSLAKGIFSFSEFYSRRIKRIFPALILILIACYAFGWFALLADEYKQLGKHIAGGAGFVSNFLLWRECGYFDNVAETKPLLHLWSLGIEEQFYIIWPLILYFAWKYRFNFLLLTTLIAIFSFAFNIYEIHTDTVGAFYSPFTRLWELSIGGILAYTVIARSAFYDKAIQKCYQLFRLSPCLAKNIKSFAGFVLLVTAIVIINKQKAFPGWLALLPTIGTYLIIQAGQDAWLNRKILSNSILVWFGLISFPLYLWHWPLLSFARIVNSATPPIAIRVIAILISVVLAWLTYVVIERPIRFGKSSNKTKIITLCLLMIVIGCVGYNAYILDGLKFRSVVLLFKENKNELIRTPATDNACKTYIKNSKPLPDLRTFSRI